MHTIKANRKEEVYGNCVLAALLTRMDFPVPIQLENGWVSASLDGLE
jgi:hypothetical protein